MLFMMTLHRADVLTYLPIFQFFDIFYVYMYLVMTGPLLGEHGRIMTNWAS